jgi:hypothetical protein
VKSEIPDLTFGYYQQEARKTDIYPGAEANDLIVPLLGLAGEAGTLLALHKKRLRDRSATFDYDARIRDDLGDILWYVATLATRIGSPLGEIASANLRKVRRRFLASDEYELYDESFPEGEKLPRRFEVEFRQTNENGREHVCMFLEGVQLGDPLTDNSADDTGYRFHDVFHLAYAAVLGWSPVIRKMLRRKRRTDPLVDEIQDGGRAIVIEEAIAALAFTSALRHNFFTDLYSLDSSLLDQISRLAEGLEVETRIQHDWQRAILEGYTVWRQMRAKESGIVSLDLEARSISYRSNW